MLFYKEKILSASQLRKLAEHKYSVESSSVLEPFLQVKTNQWMTSINYIVFKVKEVNQLRFYFSRIGTGSCHFYRCGLLQT